MPDTIFLYGTEVVITTVIIISVFIASGVGSFFLGRRYQKRRDPQTIIDLERRIEHLEGVEAKNYELTTKMKVARTALA